MLKKRKLKLVHYLILLVLFAITVGFNIRLYFINAAICSSSSTGVCGDLLTYKIAEYLAYISLLIFGIYLVYMYFISISSRYQDKTEVKEDEVTEEKINVVSSIQHEAVAKETTIPNESTYTSRKNSNWKKRRLRRNREFNS